MNKFFVLVIHKLIHKLIHRKIIVEKCQICGIIGKNLRVGKLVFD
ncbi:hypothetical protein [Moraxella lacunata]